MWKELIQKYSIGMFWLHFGLIQAYFNTNWKFYTKLSVYNSKIWTKCRRNLFFQGVRKCQNRRLTRKKIQKIKKKSLSNRLTQKSKKLRPFKFITHDFFRVHLISKNFEIFMDSWGEVSWYHIYRNNNHKLVPPLQCKVA